MRQPTGTGLIMAAVTLAWVLMSSPALAWMADRGEAYYAVPIKGPRNATVCRKLGKAQATMQNDCRLPPLSIIGGVKRPNQSRSGVYECCCQFWCKACEDRAQY